MPARRQVTQALRRLGRAILAPTKCAIAEEGREASCCQSRGTPVGGGSTRHTNTAHETRSRNCSHSPFRFRICPGSLGRPGQPPEVGRPPAAEALPSGAPPIGCVPGKVRAMLVHNASASGWRDNHPLARNRTRSVASEGGERSRRARNSAYVEQGRHQCEQSLSRRALLCCLSSRGRPEERSSAYSTFFANGARAPRPEAKVAEGLDHSSPPPPPIILRTMYANHSKAMKIEPTVFDIAEGPPNSPPPVFLRKMRKRTATSAKMV